MPKEKRKWNPFKGLFSKSHKPNPSPLPPPQPQTPPPQTQVPKSRPREIFVIEPSEKETFVVDSESNEVFEIEPAQGETFILEPTEEEIIDHKSVSKDMLIVEPTKEYEILGLDPDATDDELKKRYRKLLKQIHPDMGGDAKEFMKMRKAYLKIKEARAGEQ